MRDKRKRSVTAEHETSSSSAHLRLVSAEAPDGNELLRLVSLGDRAAFTSLYDKMAPSVYGLVRRVVCDPAQSEEVTQEIFVEVWRLAHRFDPAKGAAKTWVLTIAHRRAVDRVRSEQSQRDHLQRLSEFAPTTQPDENSFLLDRQVVREAMNSLTDVQRQSIELAYFRGLTHGQVAELLDCPLGTVKTRIRDGLIRLRDALGEGS